MKKLIYVAGPYSNGDIILNVRCAAKAGSRLLDAGFTPIVPHLTMLWHLIDPKPVNIWYGYDKEILQHCDAMLRLSGASKGADAEEDLAYRLCIPVYTSIESLIKGEA